MKTGYLVVENGYEYNDEIYHTPESEGSTPKKMFYDLEKAKKHAKELNRKTFREIDIGCYCYDLNEITSLSNEKIREELKDIIDFDGCTDECIKEFLSVGEDTSDEDVDKFMKVFNELVFHQVIKVDIDG